MTLPPDEVRLRHIRDAIETASRFASGRSRADLDDDEMLRLALTKLVEIVGEAAKQLGDATRRRYPKSLGKMPLGCATGWSIIISISIWTFCGQP